MDSINSLNLSSIVSSDLNTKFNHRCQSDWSNNNLIAFVSQDGIYILKPQPEKQSGPFEVNLIRNPTNKFNHGPVNDYLGPTFDKKWSILDNHQYMQIFLNPALATHVANMSAELYPRRFRMVKWSPVVEDFPKECILAALTSDYQLLVFARKNTAWMMADLSSEFDAYSVKSFKGDKNFDSLKGQLHSLSFCNICWHQQDKSNITLLASTISGDIIVWRLILSSKKLDRPTSHRYSFVIQAILKTRIEYITSMHIEDDLLTISARDGQVVLYDLASYIPNHGRQLKDTIILNPTAILWPEDNIEILDLYLQRSGQNTFNIVLSKSTNICWCTMTYVKDIQSNHASLSINDSFSAIDVSSPATWLRPAGYNRAVFIADDGSFFQLEFPNEDSIKNPDFEAIRTGKVDLTGMVPRGLCTSSRGKLITLISSISLLYEPNKINAPTRVTIVPTNSANNSLMNYLEKFSDEKWLEMENIQSTMDLHDSIDYMRSTFPNLNQEQYLQLQRIFKDNLATIGYPKNDWQLIRLKIFAFLSLKLSGSGAFVDEVDYEAANQDTYDSVLKYYIEKVLSSRSHRPDDLTEDQVNSLRNYRSWLEMVANGKHIVEKFSQQFKALDTSKYAKITSEHCSICQAEISFEQPRYGTCASGHRFARCARSLLIVDLKKGDKLHCEHCRRHYLAYLVWPLPANLWPCIFCQ